MATATAVDLRIEPADLKARIESGQQATILDARGQQAFDESCHKIQGDIRVDPGHFATDPVWPRDRLTVAYCT